MPQTTTAGNFTYWDTQPPARAPDWLAPNITINAPRAQYLLLLDHYLPSGYTVAGTTITEGVQVPIGWTPTPAVDPLNPAAIQAFWNAGPYFLVDADGSPRTQSQPGQPLFRKPRVYWSYVAPNKYILTGAGASLGAKING